MNKFYKGFLIFFVLFLLSLLSSSSLKNDPKILSASASSVSPTTKPTLTLSPTPMTKKNFFKVTKVIDGDTIDIDLNGVSTRIRLIGVDTPESVDPRKPVQCFAKEASNFTKDTLEGKLVYLEEDKSQGNKDKYNRLLRYIFLEDGTNLNQVLIEKGYANEYTYNVPYKYQKEFKDAQKFAQDYKQGLWADDMCITPIPTKKPTSIPVSIAVTQPSIIPQYIIPTDPPATNNNGGYVCNCAKTCPSMSCDEAYFQLNQCGCKKRDGNNDGVPCEEQCR